MQSQLKKQMLILNQYMPKFGSLTSKKTKTKMNVYATLTLMFNLLFILNGKRKACLINSYSQCINPKVIRVFEELVDACDGTLAFEWICIEKEGITDYQFIFYNTKLLTKKIIRDTLDSYNPGLTKNVICYCTSCNGGMKYADKLKNILDYPCSMRDIDYKKLKHYNVRYSIKYKKLILCPLYYDCANKPKLSVLKATFSKFDDILDYLDATSDIVVEYAGD